MHKYFASVVCSSCLVLSLASFNAMAQSPWSESYRLEAEGQYEAAIAALEPVLEESASHEFVVLRRAWLKYLDADYNDSIREYRRALELNDQSIEAKLGVTLPLLAQQRWREAAASAQSVIELSAWNYYAHIRLMAAEEGQRQWQTLARHAQSVSARYPGDATIFVYLGRAEARQGHIDAALVAYGAVLERVPGHLEATRYIAANANRK